MLQPFKYYIPQSIDEAIKLLSKYGSESKVIAGGTDIVVQMKRDLVSPKVLIDISKIVELQKVDKQSSNIVLGAALTHTKACTWLKQVKAYRALFEGLSSIGSLQIRNIATIGGNLCNAVPSADSAPPLIVLDARLRLRGAGEKERIVDIYDFFVGPKQSILRYDEVLTEIILPVPRLRVASTYVKLGPRNCMDLSVVGVAAALALDDDKKVEYIRVAIGAAAPTPLRIRTIENHVSGNYLTAKMVHECGILAADEAKPISDIRASAGYRLNMVRELTCRVLNECIAKVGEQK